MVALHVPPPCSFVYIFSVWIMELVVGLVWVVVGDVCTQLYIIFYYGLIRVNLADLTPCHHQVKSLGYPSSIYFGHTRQRGQACAGDQQ